MAKRSEAGTFSLSFGALSSGIGEQLRLQGLTATDSDSIDKWQAHADAITRLHLHRLISPAGANRARQRLMKTISGGVELRAARPKRKANVKK